MRRRRAAWPRVACGLAALAVAAVLVALVAGLASGGSGPPAGGGDPDACADVAPEWAAPGTSGDVPGATGGVGDAGVPSRPAPDEGPVVAGRVVARDVGSVHVGCEPEEAARGVLSSYRDRGDCLLAWSGELGLLGGAWGCVVHGDGWADVCVVSGSGDGADVVVCRMVPPAGDGAAGA